MSIRQIQSRKFSRGRRTSLLLRSGAAADRRKLFFLFSDGGALPRRRYSKSRLPRRSAAKTGAKAAGLMDFVANCPFVEPGFLGEYGLVEKAPHDHTNYKLESSYFAARVAQYQNSLVNRCI
jgi:hypothetical protein